MTTPFYTVMSSLPHLGASFKIAEPPILRLQLEKRLKLLPEEPQGLLYAIELLLWRSWFMPKYTVAETHLLYVHVLKAKSPFIDELAHWYLDVRSIIAAMRMRNVNKDLETDPKKIWISPRCEHHLIRHWDAPDFGLKALYPWMIQINSFLTNNDSVAVEELLLTSIWQHLSRIEAEHFFDFEALVIYILRWNIMDYWSHYSQAEVAGRLDALCDFLEHEHLIAARLGGFR